MIYGRPCDWRPTMQPALMLIWDARLFPLVGLLFVHARLWTACLVVAGLLAAMLLQRRGMSLPAGLRSLRSLAVGSFRPATSRPPRRAADHSEEAAGGRRWNAAACRAVPASRRCRRAAARLMKVCSRLDAAGRSAEAGGERR